MMSKIIKGIAHSSLTDTIYVGNMNPVTRTWVGKKQDVTKTFLTAAHSFFELNTVRTFVDDEGKDASLVIHFKKDKQGIKKIKKFIKTLEKEL